MYIKGQKNRPEYEKLRIILQQQLQMSISIEEATKIGDTLINIYDLLLSNGSSGATINADTTNR
jgi:hypothetical protein